MIRGFDQFSGFSTITRTHIPWRQSIFTTDTVRGGAPFENELKMKNTYIWIQSTHWRTGEEDMRAVSKDDNGLWQIVSSASNQAWEALLGSVWTPRLKMGLLEQRY